MASEETEIRKRHIKMENGPTEDEQVTTNRVPNCKIEDRDSAKNEFIAERTAAGCAIGQKYGDEANDQDHPGNGRNEDTVTIHTKQTAAEYAEAVRQWMCQYHSWAMMNHCSQMMAFNYLNHQLSANVTQNHNSLNQPSVIQNGTLPQTNQGQENNNMALHNLHEQRTQGLGVGVEYKVAPIWKRVIAEVIDFMLLLLIKIGVACLLVDITGGLGREFQPLDVESLMVDGEVDVERLLSMTSELMAIEVVNRIFISLFEAMCLRQGIHVVGGSTPGKRVMGLCVVSCQQSTDLANNRVLVVPAQNIGFWSALKRSFIKNFSMAFLFPMCLTALFFQNGQAAYDLLAQCIVVEDNQRRPMLRVQQ